jgi:uncharacterized protein YecT (DUF1311 family)
MFMRFDALLFVFLWSATARADETACFKMQYVRDTEICLQAELDKAQLSLDGAVKKALSHSDKRHADLLSAAQTAWEAYVSDECDVQGDQSRHGTMDAEQVVLCLVDKYHLRIDEVSRDFNHDGFYGDGQ